MFIRSRSVWIRRPNVCFEKNADSWRCGGAAKLFHCPTLTLIYTLCALWKSSPALYLLQINASTLLVLNVSERIKTQCSPDRQCCWETFTLRLLHILKSMLHVSFFLIVCSRHSHNRTISSPAHSSGWSTGQHNRTRRRGRPLRLQGLQRCTASHPVA